LKTGYRFNIRKETFFLLTNSVVINKQHIPTEKKCEKKVNKTKIKLTEEYFTAACPLKCKTGQI